MWQLNKLLAETTSKRPPEAPLTKPTTSSTVTETCSDSGLKSEFSAKPCDVKDGRTNYFGNFTY